MTLRAAIIGSGNIGCDILCKIQESSDIVCTILVGRSECSSGLQFARDLGVNTCIGGIDHLLEAVNEFDIVFDATSAAAHNHHAEKLHNCNKQIINLTPASKGVLCIPLLNGDDVMHHQTIDMITCGGQASIPILDAIKRVTGTLQYVEVVSSISAKSAGAATRLNLNHYLVTTERAISVFTGCSNTKAILNINPAEPPVSMQTAVSVIVETPDMEAIKEEVNRTVSRVRAYVPGYHQTVEPCFDGNRVFTMIKVNGKGDYLPPYSGNLDIITSASVNVAERISRASAKVSSSDKDGLSLCTN